MGTPPARLSWFLESATASRAAGAWNDALSQYETSLTLVPKEGDCRVAAEILRGIGNIHWARGDLEPAEELFQASLAIAEAAGLAECTVSALNCLAVVEQHAGSARAAEALYGRARDLAEQLGDERRAAMIEQNLGTLASVRGELETALERYESARARFQRLGDDLGAARVLNNMGMGHVDLEQWNAAARCYDEAHRLARALGDADTLAAVEINRAELQLRRGETRAARASCDRAFELFSARGSKTGIAEACKFYGAIHRAEGNPVEAMTHLSLAVELARHCGDRLLEAEVEWERARAHLDTGEDRAAHQALNRAHRLFSALQAAREVMDVERRLDRLEETYLLAARRWAARVDAQEAEGAGRSTRVAEYACRLAAEVGLTGRDLTRLQLGSLLRDLGKVDLPGEILEYAHGIPTSDWRLMRSHVERGERLIAELDFPWDVGAVVRSHHERWDGSGYPDGLAGEEIPLAARLVAVAETYDQLRVPSSGRPGYPVPEALSRLEAEAGRGLDPVLVTLFRRLIESEPEALRFVRPA